MPRIVMASLASVLAASLAAAQSPSDGSIDRLDPALDALVSPDARVTLVKGGFGFTEGPVWMERGRDSHLLFTDIPGNVIWALTPTGQATVYLTQVGYNGPEVWRWGGIQNNGRARSDPGFEEFAMIGANGLTLDPQGRLIIATYAGRSLVRIEKDGRRTVLADRFEGKRFGGPNDVVVKRDGAIYFTDGNGSLRLGAKDPAKGARVGWCVHVEGGQGHAGRHRHAGGERPCVLARRKVSLRHRQRRQLRQPLRGSSRRHSRQWPDVHRREDTGGRHHRRPARRYEGESLLDGSGTGALDHLAGRQAPRHHPRTRDNRQCRVRRRRQEDALHHGAHRNLQGQGEHAGHLKEFT